MTTLDELTCRNLGCGRTFPEHTIPIGPDRGDLIRIPGVDYDAKPELGQEGRFAGADIKGVYCPPELRYNVTAAGECPGCGVTVTVSGIGVEGASNLPGDLDIGGPTEEPGRCLCGAEVPLRWVGYCLAPYLAAEDLDGDDEVEARFSDDYVRDSPWHERAVEEVTHEAVMGELRSREAAGWPGDGNPL